MNESRRGKLRKIEDHFARGDYPMSEAFRQRQRAEKAEAEVERLRALCASRPKCVFSMVDGNEALTAEMVAWIDKIDAAGRGEGE